MTEHNIYLLQIIRKDISSTKLLIDDVNHRIKDMLSEYDNILELLKGVPGISTQTAEDLVAEIGLDMSVFPTEKHIASWAGMCPGNNESAGKKKWTHHSWKQTTPKYTYGSSMGSNPNKRYFL